MAKYKVGDRVRIVSERPDSPIFIDEMTQFLGAAFAVAEIREIVGKTCYFFDEARPESLVERIILDRCGRPGYFFFEDWISGFAEDCRDDLPSVHILFRGNLTVAELVKGGKVVKTAKAQCNPADTYSRCEGAKIAVERLFEKKRPVANDDEIKKAIAAGVAEAHKKGHRGKIGDKFVVIGNDPGMKTHHFFEIGEIVTLAEFSRPSSRYINRYGMRQWVRDEDVRPYKEGKA